MRAKPLVRRTIRWLIAWIVYHSRFLKLWLRIWGDSNPVILVYHRVVAEDGGEPVLSLPGITVSLESFRKQIEYLSNNYRVVSFEELVRMVRNGDKLRNSVVITFDDGWKDNYTNAYPVLRQHGISATIFLATDYIGTTRWFWPEKVVHILTKGKSGEIQIPEFAREGLGADLTSLRVPSDPNDIHAFIQRMKYLPAKDRESVIEYLAEELDVSLHELERKKILLGWDEVQEMAENGISFGSHTQRHLIVTQVPIERAREEIVGSKMDVEKHLDRPCIAFAYPNGDWNENTRDLVLESDYECACSLRRTLSKTDVDLYSLKRINIHEGVSSGVNGKFSECLFAVEISGFLRRVTGSGGV